MKNKKTITKLIALTAIAFLPASSTFAQTDLGAACGCPTPVSSRPTALLSAYVVNGGAGDGNLINNKTLSCDTTWILDKKIYVPTGKTLTINPGTVIKGREYPGQPANATALVVSVGGKIIADGTESCQVVFTAEADNLDGLYPIENKGKWGGVLIAGKATNNLTLAANGPFNATGNGRLCVADGIGTFEGFASSDTRDQFGVTPASFDDNDSSGVLRYVSIRHAGAILVQGGEINGLTLGSVGRKTVLEHIEIVSCADDGIEFFGGTVNVKWITMMFGNDDNFDWDLGWSGKAQFLFVLKTDTMASKDADNGFEMDGDDQNSNLFPRSHPVIFNATMIGNIKTVNSADNSGMAAIQAKDLTEGEIYNSVFASFKYGLLLRKNISSPRSLSQGGNTWDNWQNGTPRVTANGNPNSLRVKCNTFTNILSRPIALESAGNAASADDSIQFYVTDKNVVLPSIPGFDYGLAINNNSNVISHPVDANPTPGLSVAGCPVPPSDGFFSPADYRGAFSPYGQNWLSPWAYATMLYAVTSLHSCPTDLDFNGVTDVDDFLILLGEFGQQCD